MTLLLCVNVTGIILSCLALFANWEAKEHRLAYSLCIVLWLTLLIRGLP